MSETTTAENASIADAVHEITQSSKQMIDAGERIADNLNALEKRVQHAFDLKAQVSERPWVVAAGAVVAGVMLWRMLR